jgi:hypothetical protein
MMLASANNYDFTFFHLKVVARQQSHPLHSKFDNFLVELRNTLVHHYATPLKRTVEKKLGEIFELRLDILRWMSSESIDYQEMLRNEVLPILINMNKVSRFNTIANHICNALRTMELVIDNINRSNEEGANLSHLSVQSIPELTFKQFIDATNMFPHKEQSRSFQDWCISSLYIEYLTLAAYIMYEEELIVPETNLMQVASLLGEATRAYASLAASLGFTQTEQRPNIIRPQVTSKGASIFKRMLDEKNEIHQHLRKGGVLADLKDKFNFANPIYFRGQ